METNSSEKKNSTLQRTTNRLSDAKKTGNKGKSKNVIKKISEKKIWTINTLVEAMKPSDEELEYRKKKSNESDAIQKYSKLFQCTTCQMNLETVLKKHEKVPAHPCLGVLMCQKCCDYYEDGEFSLDSEGEEKYCRWCGEGGTIFSCSKCICGFCATCIKRHFKLEFFKQIQKDDNWLCFFCNPKPLWDLRYICSLAVQMYENQETLNSSLISNKREKSKLDSSFNNSNESLSSKNTVSQSLPKSGKRTSKKRIYSSSSDDSQGISDNDHKKLKLNISLLKSSAKEEENESFESLKSKVLKELEKILELSESQMSFGVIWCAKMSKTLSKSDLILSHKELVNKCQKIKSFLSVLSSYLVQLSSSADSMEKVLLGNGGRKTFDFQDKEKSSYITVLQFLGFINNQIKTFMEKGISFSDILDSGFYDDDNVIEIKKKLSNSRNTFNQDENTKSFESKTNFEIDDYDGTENMEDTEEQKGDDEDDNNLEISDPNSEMNSKTSDDEFKELNSSNVTLEDTYYLKKSDSKDDIKEILAILENA